MSELVIEDAEDQSPQVVLILQDTAGELEVVGVQRPSAYDPKSRAHVVGKWLAENMEQICDWALKSGVQATVRAPEPVADQQLSILLPRRT